jgi:dihydrofolate reductase
LTKLIYSAIMSLDGYIEDEHGNFDWSAPDEEVHAFINERQRAIGTYLMGRRMYDVMQVWDSLHEQPDSNAVMLDFAAQWRDADKVVYSTTLAEASTARTRIEREFDPDAIRQMKVAASKDLSIAGPELAGHALKAGLVDELQLYLNPIVVGGGKYFLPRDHALDLDLLEERRFGDGVVYLRYRIAAPA